MNYSVVNNLVSISYTKFGLIEIKNSSLEQSLEIVRRRIDETGTKDPTIIRRGNDRILIELPGLDDPNRIKNLLGKSANLTFRLVSEEDDNFGSDLLYYEEDNKELKLSSSSDTSLKVKFAVFPNRFFILLGSFKPGSSINILSLPLLIIVGSLVPVSSILLLTISRDCSREEFLISINPNFV
jgi:hypothetical protein